MSSENKVVSNELEQFLPNEWQRIALENLPWEEKRTVLFLRALQDDCFSGYQPRPLPSVPHGYMQAYEIYRQTKPSEKSAAWKEVTLRFSGYFKALDEKKAENLSDLVFLEEMKNHFEKVGLQDKADICKRRIFTYQEAERMS